MSRRLRDIFKPNLTIIYELRQKIIEDHLMHIDILFQDVQGKFH